MKPGLLRILPPSSPTLPSSALPCSPAPRPRRACCSSAGAIAAAAPYLDRAALVRSHEAVLRPLSARFPDMPLEAPQACHGTAAGSSGWKEGALQPIVLAEMEAGKRHAGRKLCGVLCVDPVTLGRVVATVLEDGHGRAVRVLIQHAVLWGSPMEEAQRLFPKGIRVCVEHPVLGHSFLAEFALWVQTPASLHVVTHFPDLQDTLSSWSSTQLRQKGNKDFRLHKLGPAIELYTMSIRAGLGTEDRVLGYADRAQAWLKLGSYEKALADATEALRSDPTHEGALLCKVMAMQGLQQYEEACSCLVAAMSSMSWSSRMQHALERSTLLNEQSQRGENNLSSFMLSGCKKENIPECSDFVGPVKISMTRDGRGRGLFLTADAKLGDLLIVSNALGFVDNGGHNLDLRSDAITMAVKQCIASPRLLGQLYTLADSESQTSREVPDVDMFRPNSKSIHHRHAEDELPIDIDRIRAIFARNSFSHSLSPGIAAESQARYSGLWMLPSFLNHSCLPTASLLTVGKTMFVHAARDLSAGDELTFSYIESLMPWGVYRRDLCSNGWGFVCRCERCILEESLAKCFEEVDGRFRELMSGEQDAARSFAEMAQVAADVEKRLQSLVQLTGKEKQWIRAAYFSAYGVPAVNVAAGVKMPTTSSIMEALLISAPGHLKTTALMPHLASRCEPEAQDKGMELLSGACMAAFGRQDTCVVEAIILQLYAEGMDALLPR